MFQFKLSMNENWCKQLPTDAILDGCFGYFKIILHQGWDWF